MLKMCCRPTSLVGTLLVVIVAVDLFHVLSLSSQRSFCESTKPQNGKSRVRRPNKEKHKKVSNAALVFCALTNDFHMSIPSVRAGPEPVRPTELKRASPQLKEKISYQISSTYFIIKCLLASYRTNGLFFGKSVT